MSTLTECARVHTVTLAVAFLRFDHAAILTLEHTLVAIGPIPELVAVASARRSVCNTMFTLDHALVAKFTCPSFLTHTSAVICVELPVDARLVAVVVDKQLACVTLWPHPRKYALVADAAVGVKKTTVVAVLGAILRTVQAIVGPDAVVTDAAVLVQKPTALAVFVTFITSVPSEETIALAGTLVGIEFAVDAVEIACIAFLTTPKSVANTRAITPDLAILAF